jgi:S-ribosylhomocysteine lyase LuxS involved in autoinducer biosynthesis
MSLTDNNTTTNVTDYPINYADPNSPTDGAQELRTLEHLMSCLITAERI